MLRKYECEETATAVFTPTPAVPSECLLNFVVCSFCHHMMKLFNSQVSVCDFVSVFASYCIIHDILLVAQKVNHLNCHINQLVRINHTLMGLWNVFQILLKHGIAVCCKLCSRKHYCCL